MKKYDDCHSIRGPLLQNELARLLRFASIMRVKFDFIKY
jgi:hypothetical protein